jgi:ornithine cyclodeaminase/alanine dehydrogenase-like protein (mu-crystallin family)
MKTRIIGLHDLARLVARVGLNALMDGIIERLARAFADPAFDRRDLRARGGLHYESPHLGLLEWMPHLARGRSATIKMIAYHPDNPTAYALPTVLGHIGRYDVRTGHLVALIDGVFPTALRTGAASAVASRILALPASETLGLIGAGAQAVTQTHAISRVLPIRRVLAFDIDPRVSKSFPDRTRFLGLDVRAAPLAEVEQSADVLCTVTSVAVGAGPVIEGRRLKDHVHINAVGSDFSGKWEIPCDVLKASLVCPDFPAQAVVEGECQQLGPAEIGPDILNLASSPESYASWRERRTVFDSTGFALEDHVALDFLLDMIQTHELGSDLEIESIPDDAQNPYDFLGDSARAG